MVKERMFGYGLILASISFRITSSKTNKERKVDIFNYWEPR